jgi:hypothetical protein
MYMGAAITREDFFCVLVCTIYERLSTCLMYIPRFALKDKITLWLMKLYFQVADVVAWSIALDIRLYDLCSGVSMVRVHIPCKENKNNVSFNYTLVITLKPVNKVHNYIVSSFIIIYTSEILTQRCWN